MVLKVELFWLRPVVPLERCIQGDVMNTNSNNSIHHSPISDQLRVDGPLREPGEPGHLPPPGHGPNGNRTFFHCLVLRLRGHINQVHPGSGQRSPLLNSRINFHGIRYTIPHSLGGNLRVAFKLDVSVA